MNYPRVNLLEKEEQRYQGVISHRAILISIAVIPLVFALLFLGIGFLQHEKAVSELKKIKTEWVKVEPQFGIYKTELRRQNNARRALELMLGWKNAGIPVSKFLMEVQVRVPENIQITKLSLDGETASSSSFSTTNDCVIAYEMLLDGIALGDRAEASVIGFRRSLMDEGFVSTTFKSIKLASMRKRVEEDGQNMREFSIEGFSTEREQP
jgi:Tfp pilus assembly protein PilN